MTDILEEILRLRGIPGDSPTVLQDGSKTVIFMEKKLVYSVTEEEDQVLIHAQAKLTQKPNYKLLNTLNNTLVGCKFTIVDQNMYCCDVNLLKSAISDLEKFVEYVFMQAEKGYKILNTTSENKRRQLLAETNGEN